MKKDTKTKNNINNKTAHKIRLTQNI